MCDIGVERCEVDFEPVAREPAPEPEQTRPAPAPVAGDPPTRAPATASS
ncbi:hypothetical protein FHX42_002261 [Saccharopolyspora lacisalsi]|uniref:Uncharacterized protein n=1 Tax=Halosaccharopolyspora lacisalsi TaxID=1000566 RepID=A0A839DTU5_9PSEU|nr:hypothetical protein [Halosaccharopolyspora lacisalsi]